MKIWTKERFEKAVKESTGIGETLRNMGVKPVGGNYKQFHRYVKEYDVDISHFSHTTHPKDSRNKKLPFEELTDYRRIKDRILKDNLLEYKCDCCGIDKWITPKTPDGKLMLQLDHIDGNNTNHKLENLRLLCPNCHSQTDTYCGRKNKKHSEPHRCIDCGTEIGRTSERCSKCFGVQNEKIKWPPDSDLINMLKTKSFYAVGKEPGVTDNNVRKRLSRRGLLEQVLDFKKKSS